MDTCANCGKTGQIAGSNAVCGGSVCQDCVNKQTVEQALGMLYLAIKKPQHERTAEDVEFAAARFDYGCGKMPWSGLIVAAQKYLGFPKQ